MGNIELFDQMAESYDTGERARIAKIIAQAIRSQVGEARDKSALDYGCGTGLVGLELTDVFGSIMLVDASERMVRQVRKKIGAAGLKNADAHCFDLMGEVSLKLTVDYIILAQVLLHIPDVTAILSRLYSLLNEGGHLLIVDFDKTEAVVSDMVHNGFDQQELTRRCTSVGFAGATAETFHIGEKYFMGKDASLFLLDAVKEERR